jgi:hypothetical protein
MESEKKKHHLFRPLDESETKILEKFKIEVDDKSVLDVLDAEVPLSAAFVDFTHSLIQQNVQPTHLIGSPNMTEEILKLDLFESQHLNFDWTKDRKVILLFHAEGKQWITFWAVSTGEWITLSKNMREKKQHLFRPLDESETEVLEKMKIEKAGNSVLDVLDSKVPMSADFVDFTLSLIQQNVQPTHLIGSHNMTKAILNFESQKLDDWTKDREVILLFHKVGKQWITVWANLREEWITAFDWQDREAGDMNEDIKDDARNKISAVLTKMAKKSKKELTLTILTVNENYPRPSDSDFFIMAALSAYAAACEMDPFKYIEFVKAEIGSGGGDRDPVRERILLEFIKGTRPDIAAFIERKRKESELSSADVISKHAADWGLDPFEYIQFLGSGGGDRDPGRETILFEYVKQERPNVAAFIESKRKEPEDNSGDEHGPKIKRHKAPNYSQWPPITRETSVDQKWWVKQSFGGVPNNGFDSQFTLDSFKTLMEEEWLGDQVINKFFEVLEKREEEMQKNGDLDTRSFFCNTYFLVLLERTQGSKDSVTRVTTGMVGCDKIYVPAHINGNHWALYTVSMQEKQIEYYDSLGLNGTSNSHMKCLLKYLCDTDTSRELVPGDWTTKNVEVPRQENSKYRERVLRLLIRCWKCLF